MKIINTETHTMYIDDYNRVNVCRRMEGGDYIELKIMAYNTEDEYAQFEKGFYLDTIFDIIHSVMNHYMYDLNFTEDKNSILRELTDNEIVERYYQGIREGED